MAFDRQSGDLILAKIEQKAGEARMDSDRLYRAPALEKGLDILELLASEEQPLTVSAIVQRLGRSTGELFRMVQVLEHRGFIALAADGSGYVLTNRLFSLGMDRPPVRNLTETALPVMRALSRTISQSCHLAIHSEGQMVIVARMESAGQIGFSVRIGYRRPIISTLSGATLYAFQPAEIRKRWEALMVPKPTTAEINAFRIRCDAIRTAGRARAPSDYVPGIVDVSAPIMRGDLAAAALTVPFVETLLLPVPIEDVAEQVDKAARDISRQLFPSDART